MQGESTTRIHVPSLLDARIEAHQRLCRLRVHYLSNAVADRLGGVSPVSREDGRDASEGWAADQQAHLSIVVE